MTAPGRPRRRTKRPPSLQSEKEFQSQVVHLARLHGWRVYHTFDSRKSAAGFPDLILLRGVKLIAIECKSAVGKVTEEQMQWLIAFSKVERVQAFVLRPADQLDDLELVLR